MIRTIYGDVSLLRSSISIAAALLLAACGSSNSGGSGPAAPGVETLGESLTALGVDTEPGPRLDSQGNAYPDSYAPLGETVMVREIPPVDAGLQAEDDEPTYIVGRAEELFLGGFRLATRQFTFSAIDDISIAGLTPEEANITEPVILEGREVVEVPWAAEEGEPFFGPNPPPQGTRRDAAALDTDGDGFPEAVAAYAIETQGGVQELRLQVMDGDGSTPTFDAGVLAGGPFLPAYDVRIGGADFDGDGRDEIAIVIARRAEPGVVSTPVGLYILDDAQAGYAVIDGHELAYTAAFTAPVVTVNVAPFHADHDNRDEIAVVLNESDRAAQAPGNYAARYYVLGLGDDGAVELTSGPITGSVLAANSVPRQVTAVTASIATGDIDGDSLDELLFAGFEEVVESCKYQDASAGVNRGAQYLLIAYGGRYNNFAPIRAGAAEVFPTQCRFESGWEPFVMRQANVNILDFDGDEDMDIQVNDMVLEQVPLRAWSDELIAFLADSRLIYGNDIDRRYYDRSESAFAVSDQTGDGIQDIIAMYQDPNTSDGYVKVYTWDPDEANGYRIATRIQVEPDDEFNKNPIIVPMDVDNDKVATLRYTGEHFLDITEPLVLAAIAAAPCKRDIGQDSCYSTWGSSQSGAIGREFSVKVSGSAGAGAGSAGVGLLGKWLVKVSASAALKTSASYQLSKSQTFSTGPFEDGVIFTSIPVDRFLYELIRDNTDQGGVIGQRMEIRLPRTPNIRIVERRYYNASIIEGAEPIDDRVFSHVTGDISTYPTAAEKDDILATQQSLVMEFRLEEWLREGGRIDAFDFLPAERGLEVGPVLVGEGGGATELALEYTETVGATNELAMGLSFEAEMLFGAAISWSAGIEFGRTLSVSHGDTTLFAGSVDSIDERFYQSNVYGFGLFAYLQQLGDQEIEVINFWVEE